VVDGAFVQPEAVAPEVSDVSHGGKKIRVVVSEGRNREVSPDLSECNRTWLMESNQQVLSQASTC